ncbi:unnamed protein product [Adineta steineri]|uniref:Enoyl reductase (ER) domain-containing protein n=1 Tax=Adineta steineri TaxID=433720 RepID=A0A814AHU2_9BILA|nr:unnamed protein product [Adineta steineri]CAF1364764.1 unnamed protein product [Adineta steineri]
MLQNNDEQEKSQFEQISIIPKRDADEKAFQDREKALLLAGTVEVRVHCVGINFRVVPKSRGLYLHTRTFAQSVENQPKFNRDTEPGSDFVGTIVRVGPRTTSFQVGDHVVDSTTGQTVLIHVATGASGQWCIQYCQYIGTRVIATATTEEKRRFLREYYGIEHVFNSRNTSFVNQIPQILPQGVDVIVNSLSSNLLKESIKVLAYHGYFVEWSKRDIYHNSSLSMFQLRSDCSFHVIDFAGLADHVSPLIRLMLEETIDLFVQQALLRYKSGQVMGKTAFRITSSDQPLNIHKKQINSLLKVVSDNTMFPSEVCNQATILISDGFVSLGLTISRWMIEQRGVKHIAFVKYKAHVDVVQADVTDFQQVHDLIKRFNKTPYPIRGIIHSAVVAEDRALNNLTQEHSSLVLPPKVHGAWYLQQATQLLHAPIHFFIMLSSIRNHLLEVASAGYNAGNQFLDALTYYRFTKFTLSALSVSLPAVSGAGMFHRHKEMLSTLKKHKVLN